MRRLTTCKLNNIIIIIIIIIIVFVVVVVVVVVVVILTQDEVRGSSKIRKDDLERSSVQKLAWNNKLLDHYKAVIIINNEFRMA